MNSGTITVKELAEVVDQTARTIQRRATKENWPYKNGSNRTKAFIISKLPAEIQSAITEKTDVPKSLLPSLAPEAALTAARRITPAPMIRGPKTVPLADWQKKKALAWADLVRLYLIYIGEHGGWGKGAKVKKDFLLGYNAGSYPTLLKELGRSSVKTLERKVLDLKKSNNDAFVAFAPKYGGKKGTRSIDHEQAQVLLSIVCSPYNPKKITEIIRTARSVMHQRGISNGLCDATYRRWLQDWVRTHGDQWALWTGGEKALNDQYAYWIKRDYSRIEVGDVLIADGHVLNFDIINPWTGKPKRMMLVLWQDMKSAMPLGWEIMPTENTQAINAALRRSIMRLGMIPKVAYLDNGKAFAGKYFNGTNLEEDGFAGLYGRLGIETIFAWPYHGQSKPVERFFGDFGELERMSPSYVGACIADKPPRLNRGEKFHRALHEKITGGRVPTLIESHRAVAAWFDEWAHRPHQGGHLKGLKSQEVFDAGKGPGVNDRDLRYLMMREEVRTIRRRGIQIFGNWYYHAALYGRKHKVDVRYDIEDPTYLLVYEQNTDELICKATPPPEVHPVAGILGTDEDKALLKEQIEFKRSLTKQTMGSAKAFLDAEIIPEVQKRIQDTGFEATGVETKHALSLQTSEKPKKNNVVKLSEADKAVINDQFAALEKENKGTGKIDWDSLREMADMDRYEKLIEYEMQSVFIPKDEQGFMKYFEDTEQYERFADYFEEYRAKMSLMYQTGGD